MKIFIILTLKNPITINTYLNTFIKSKILIHIGELGNLKFNFLQLCIKISTL